MTCLGNPKYNQEEKDSKIKLVNNYVRKEQIQKEVGRKLNNDPITLVGFLV